MLSALIAAAITTWLVRRSDGKTSQRNAAKVQLWCLIFTVISFAIDTIDGLVRGSPDALADAWKAAIAFVLMIWVFVAGSRLSVGAISLFQIVLGTLVGFTLIVALRMPDAAWVQAITRSQPMLWVSWVIVVITQFVGAASGIYYLCTWNHPVGQVRAA